MKLTCSLLLLVVAASVAVSAAKPAQTFADWLAYQGEGKAGKAGASSVEPSYDYEETELLDACLRAVTRCPEFGTIEPPTLVDREQVLHSTFGVACCNNKHYNKEMNSFLSHPDEAGDFEFTVFPRNVIDEYHDGGVTLKGTFIAQGYLHERASDCGHPFCDKMVLTVTGKYYEIKNAVMRTLPDELEFPAGCPAKGAVAPPEKKTVVKAASYHEEPTWYKVTTAVIYMGTVTVNSRLHSTKFSDAWFEFVPSFARTDVETISPNDAEDKYCLDPYLMKLTFIKNKAGY